MMMMEDLKKEIQEITGKHVVMGYRSLYDRLPGGSEGGAAGQGPSGAYLTVYEAYEAAAEVPKIMELSNMWLQLEVALADIWRGEDAGEEMAGFMELLQAQLD